MMRLHLSRPVALACVLALASPVPAQVNLPSLGESVSEQFSPGAERRLGDQVMREIRRDPDYLDDPLLLEYVQSVWLPLLQAARARGDLGADIDARFAWEAFLVRDRSVNAFALPGGYVGVHLGLVAVAARRDELAAVLAHELSHVTQRHIARSISNQQRQTMLGMASMILGVLAATRSSRPDAANALIHGGQAVAVQGMLNFSRDMEREADRIGYALLDRAGFSASGMASMFEKLDAAARLNDSNGYPYLRSHPLTTDRIGEARSRGASAAEGAGGGSRLEHELMRARARALMDPRIESLRRLQQQDGAEAAGGAAPERIGMLAAAAQASLLLREPARARASLERAQALLAREATDARAQRALALLQAQALLAAGEAAAAMRVLDGLDADAARPVQLARAQAALAQVGEAAARRSADELQTRVAGAAHDALSWDMLALLWRKLGQPLRALRAEAESRAAVGDLGGAVDRLRAGQRLGRSGNAADFIEVSVLDARARELEAQRRQLAAELRAAGRQVDDR